MKREVIAELLDEDLGTPEEIADSLNDLRHINSWFGGTQTTATLLRRIVEETGKKELSLLEIGAGLGDVPLGAQRATCDGRRSVAGNAAGSHVVPSSAQRDTCSLRRCHEVALSR